VHAEIKYIFIKYLIFALIEIKKKKISKNNSPMENLLNVM